MSTTIITSVVTGGSNNHSTVSSEANAYATDFVSQGCLGTLGNSNGAAPCTGSFGVSQDSSPDMGVTITGTGNTTNSESVAYVNCTPGSQDLQVLRARMSANYTGYTINSNSTGSTVYDWIYLQANTTNAATPDSAADNVINLYTSRSTSNTADNGSPPTYGILLAVVTVANGASSITNANIADKRTQATIAVPITGTNGWTPLGTALTYSANNGYREFALTASSDLTGTLSPGMRLKASRSVSPPTECAAFASASSQYATKSSPSGITFTGTFTVEAWIFLNSYTGQTQYILARTDEAGTTGGWALRLLASGQVDVYYGTTSSFTEFTSYMSVPLNQWVHVAAVITSVSSKTAQIYMDGYPIGTNTASSNSTTLTQASVDLRVGAASATPSNTYFNGYISELRLWSTNQTTANIQANMTKSLVGNETNLIGLWQFNGAWTDATSNANTLTATNGPSNTQVSNPYNATEYAIISAISYSSPTTTITCFTGPSCTLPNMTLNTPQFSTSKNPYGMPAALQSILLLAYLCASQSTTSSTYVGIGVGVNFTVPTGSRVRLTGKTRALENGTSSSNSFFGIWDGTVGSGTQLDETVATAPGTNTLSPATVGRVLMPTAGVHGYYLGLASDGTHTAYCTASTAAPAYIMAEVLDF